MTLCGCDICMCECVIFICDAAKSMMCASSGVGLVVGLQLSFTVQFDPYLVLSTQLFAVC